MLEINDDAEALRFPGSPANGNNALRTLSRILSKAKECKLLHYVPEFKLFKETGRTLKLDDEAERKLLPHAEQPLRDIIVIMRDTGMRNGRELYRMRIENIDWTNRVIFNPDSKTARGRRFVPLSDRVLEILKVRCAGRTEGWVFPRLSQRQAHLLRHGEQTMAPGAACRWFARRWCSTALGMTSAAMSCAGPETSKL